jgi:hypothetical protein
MYHHNPVWKMTPECFRVQLRRFDQVMDHVYPGNTMPRWSDLFEHANYVKAIKHEEDVSGLYTLYFLQRYNGEVLVKSNKKVINRKYSITYMCMLMYSYRLNHTLQFVNRQGNCQQTKG